MRTARPRPRPRPCAHAHAHVRVRTHVRAHAHDYVRAHHLPIEPLQCLDKIVGGVQLQQELLGEFFNMSASLDPETGEELYDYSEGSDIYKSYEDFLEENVKQFMVAAPLIECSFQDEQYML